IPILIKIADELREFRNYLLILKYAFEYMSIYSYVQLNLYHFSLILSNFILSNDVLTKRYYFFSL
ncbi:MAG: hypothetical protein ACI4DK_11900, partial [Lachnospiraceae bacterium]